VEVAVMWSHTVVIFDLAAVGLVFWYVFLHHTKPYEIKGDPWGLYGDGSEAVETHTDMARATTFIYTAVDDPGDLFGGEGMDAEFDFAA
jgi:hypothetical protein